MHHSINRQERRTRLKLLQDLTQCPLVFCDKSMHRPLDDVTIKSIGLVKRDRPVSRVLRARICIPPARPLPFGLCRLHTKDGRNRVDWEIHIKAEAELAPDRRRQRRKSRDRILPRAFVTSPNPFDGPIITHIRTCSNTPTRAPPGVLAQLLLFCQLLHALVHAGRGQPDAMPTAIPIRYVTAVIAATDAMPSSMPSPLVPLFPMRRRGTVPFIVQRRKNRHSDHKMIKLS